MSANNKRLVVSIFWIILGLALIVLTSLGYLDSSFFTGLGGGFIAVGALQTYRHIKYNRDPEYRELVDTEENDERNRYIRMKAWSYTGYIAVLGSAIASIALRGLGKTEQSSLLVMVMCLILAVYCISYLIIRKKN